MAVITVNGTRYRGELAVDPVTTEHDGSLRWAEFYVYLLDDGRWLLHRTGMSRVYHSAGTSCTRFNGQPMGSLVRAGSLPHDAVPCQDCHPPALGALDDSDPVRHEKQRNKVDVCETEPEVVEALTTYRQRDRGVGSWTVKVSEPVAELLDALEEAFPAFAALPRPVPTAR